MHMPHTESKPGTTRPVGWARVWPTAKRTLRRILRRGAWYPVVQEESDRVELDIAGRVTAVPKRVLELRPSRPVPKLFTVVHRPADESRSASGGRVDLGDPYAVCPQCRTRSPIFGHPDQITCRECGTHSDIGWWETG